MPLSDDLARSRAPVLRKYARLAARYDQLWSFYVQAAVRETMRRLRLRDSSRLLDVGCGTGALLQALSRSFPRMRLAGVDPSREMLAVARGKLGPAVELRVAWAEAIPYADASFDIVASCSAFHYFRKPLAALREMARVLEPGGWLAITDWCDDFLACRICDRVLRAFNRAHVRVYRERECRALLQAAAIGPVTSERYKINWLWGLITATAEKRATA